MVKGMIYSVTIDTPMNRKFMPDADFSTWTSPEDIAKWVFVSERLFLMTLIYYTLVNWKGILLEACLLLVESLSVF